MVIKNNHLCFIHFKGNTKLYKLSIFLDRCCEKPFRLSLEATKHRFVSSHLPIFHYIHGQFISHHMCCGSFFFYCCEFVLVILETNYINSCCRII